MCESVQVHIQIDLSEAQWKIFKNTDNHANSELHYITVRNSQKHLETQSEMSVEK